MRHVCRGGVGIGVVAGTMITARMCDVLFCAAFMASTMCVFVASALPR